MELIDKKIIIMFVKLAHQLNDNIDDLSIEVISSCLNSLDEIAIFMTNILEKDEIIKLINNSKSFNKATKIHDKLNKIYRKSGKTDA